MNTLMNLKSVEISRVAVDAVVASRTVSTSDKPGRSSANVAFSLALRTPSEHPEKDK
jgi:hypothetical protein